MTPPDPWIFGWTQLLTIVGLALTGSIALFGFRTFARWKREKLEEKRIEIAFDALAIAYEAKFVFQSIRSPLFEGYEWADMPHQEGETEEARNKRGPYYATFKRIRQNKDFFERVWSIQPRSMAAFGREIESTFLKLHKARRSIEIAAQMLAERVDDRDEPEDQSTKELYRQLRRDRIETDIEKDRVGKMLKEFEQEIEAAARPVINQKL